MNVMNPTKMSNYTDVSNVPIGKWVHIGVVVHQRTMDIYLNGLLKSRTLLDGLPKQNFGDLYLTQNGGFNGFISRFRYFSYAVSFATIETEINHGPSLKMDSGTSDVDQMPPYLSRYYWFNNDD